MSNHFTASVNKGNTQGLTKPELINTVNHQLRDGFEHTHTGLYLAAWLELTTLVLAVHSDAELGAHQTPSSNPCQKLGGTHLELLIASSLWRNCDPREWEGCAFCQNMSKQVRQLLLYGKRESL